MKQYRKLFFLGFICAAWPVSYAHAQDVSAGVPDSLLTIGYTVGHTRNISSLVESFTGKQLKADQITNPLEAIYGKVPGLTIQRAANGTAALDAVRLRGTTSDQRQRPADYHRRRIRRYFDAYVRLSYGHRELHYPEGCFRNGAVRFAGCIRRHRDNDQERSEGQNEGKL